MGREIPRSCSEKTMKCNGICSKYKTVNRYRTLNHKRCSICGIFIFWEGFRCPCCSYVLKRRPSASKYKDAHADRFPDAHAKRV